MHPIVKIVQKDIIKMKMVKFCVKVVRRDFTVLNILVKLYVQLIFVLVPTVLLQLEQLVLQTVPTYVRLAIVDTTKRVILAPDADLHVVLDYEKRLLVLRHPIVYVLKTPVRAPTVLLLLQLLVLRTMPTFARPVPADTTKMVTPVLDVDLVAVREQEKHLLVLLHPIVYVPKIIVLVPMVQL